MKAILKIGSFSTMVDVPPGRRVWDVIAPSTRIRPSFESATLEEVSQVPMHKRWRFEYSEMLHIDGSPEDGIALFIFTEEL